MEAIKMTLPDGRIEMHLGPKLYVAKRHVPKTCEYCGLYAAAERSNYRCFAGSYYWLRGWHMHCALKETYGDDVQYQESLKDNPFAKLIDHDASFDGGTYYLPIPLTR